MKTAVMGNVVHQNMSAVVVIIYVVGKIMKSVVVINVVKRMILAVWIKMGNRNVVSLMPSGVEVFVVTRI